MNPDKNQSELDRYRDIIFTTIDYTIEKESALLKPEEINYSENFHRLWREHVEEQYRTNALDKLKKSLDNLSVIYKMTGDLDYVNFIKEKTGHDFDLFGNIYERIDKIIARKRIANRKERLDVATILQLYRKTSIGQENAPLLINLQNAFTDSQRKIKSAEEAFSNIYHLLEINSPDNKRYVTMYESRIEVYPSTCVNIHFEDGLLSSLYAAEGINLTVKIFWKDNSTVVIETQKDNTAIIKQSRSQHLDDMINVEYIEK